MDNVKTGALIKALRLERGFTQKQLAEKLNVTDRAVSKWERGKNAPDIALLEPLAEILGVTVLELIRGERVQSESRTEVESAALEVIDYSPIEIKRRRRERNKSLIATAATLLVIAAFVLFACWQADTSEFEVARQVSPDGECTAVVYNREFGQGRGGFTDTEGVALSVYKPGGQIHINYGECTFRGLAWAPDSTMYVLELEDWGGNEGITLKLSNMVISSERELDVYISTSAVAAGIIADAETAEFDFIRWAEDSVYMLIRYEAESTGYFWYNYDTGEIEGILEI